MMDWHDYIHSNPDVLLGKPVIKGTRISVEMLLELYAKGWDEGMILESYPMLKSEALRAVFYQTISQYSHHSKAWWGV